MAGGGGFLTFFFQTKKNFKLLLRGDLGGRHPLDHATPPHEILPWDKKKGVETKSFPVPHRFGPAPPPDETISHSLEKHNAINI